VSHRIIMFRDTLPSSTEIHVPERDSHSATEDREQPAATPPPMEREPPWASLQQDLVRLVASRLLAQYWFDYVRFRYVCA
jgi:hypothetical protein